LTSIGYKEKSKIRKTGEFIKYKNDSITVFLCNVEKISMYEAIGVNEASTNNATHQAICWYK
jgi:adenylate cyclase class IV